MARRGRMSRALARKQDKQFSWYAALDTVCGGIRLPPRYCLVTDDEGPDVVVPQTIDCETGVAQGQAAPVALHLVAPRIPTIETADPGGAGFSDQAYEADEVTVVKMVGYVTLEPYYVADEDLLNTLAALDPGPASAVVNNTILNTPYFLRAGLRKDAWLFDPDQVDYTPPRRDPLETEEWTDGRFLRTWQKEKYAAQKAALTSAFSTPATFLCSNTSAAAAGAPGNTLSNGSGTISIPAITTTCQFIANTTATDAIAGVQGWPEGVVKINLNSRRRLRFRESEGLVLWLNWTSWDKRDLQDSSEEGNCIPAQVAGRMAVGFDVRTHVKLLLETN